MTLWTILAVYYLLVGAVSVSGSHWHLCDIFSGYWTENFIWQPLDCPNYPRLFSEFLMTKQFESEETEYRMLVFGDSNDWKTMIDNNKLIGAPIRQITSVGQGVFSVFPYETDYLNYCIEYQSRTKEEKIYPRNNTGVIEAGFQKFFSIYPNKEPNIIGFSINFWEMVRTREEMSCETGKVAEESKVRWNKDFLDEEYVQRWKDAYEISLLEAKRRAEAVSAILYTRTFQIPRLDAKGYAVHTNLHSSNFIRQLNAAIIRRSDSRYRTYD